VGVGGVTASSGGQAGHSQLQAGKRITARQDYGRVAASSRRAQAALARRATGGCDSGAISCGWVTMGRRADTSEWRAECHGRGRRATVTGEGMAGGRQATVTGEGMAGVGGGHNPMDGRMRMRRMRRHQRMDGRMESGPTQS